MEKEGWREKGGMEGERRRDVGGKGTAPPIGCLSTKSGGGFAGRGRGGAGDCWGAEVGAQEAAVPPRQPFCGSTCLGARAGRWGRSRALPDPPRPGGAVRGAGRGGGLHATVGNVLPRPPRLPIDRDKHANEFLCMSLAYRQIAGGGAAVCALQRALMQHPNSHCGSLPPAAPAAPRAPRRGQWDPITPSHPPARPATAGAAPPGTRLVQPARGCRAQGYAGINKAKPREKATLFGLFLCFHLFSVFFHLVQGRKRAGGPSAAASCSPAPAAAVN